MKKSIGRLMSILHRQSQIYMNCTLKEYNITSAEYSFLMYLYRHDGVTQDELSAYLLIDKSATARSIKSLEEKQYIIRLKDDMDKRYNRVFLTDKSKRIKDDLRQKVWHWSEILSDGLNPEIYDILYNELENMVNKVNVINFKEEDTEE